MNRLNRHKVVYGDEFFASSWFAEWENLKVVLAQMLDSEPKWRNILDFGCGPGVMIDFMRNRGVSYFGCDYSPDARSLYIQHYGKHQDKYYTNLNDALERGYDLFLSFDVFEHMTDEEIDKTLADVSEIPELLLNISRAKGIPGHINLKSDGEWVAFMEARGLRFDEERTLHLRKLYAQERDGSPDHWDRNLFLFVRVALG